MLNVSLHADERQAVAVRLQDGRDGIDESLAQVGGHRADIHHGLQFGQHHRQLRIVELRAIAQ